MATQVQLRRGTTAENDAFTGAQGELTFDTNNKRVRVHDGGTAGGFEIKTEDGSGNTIFADNEKAIFGAGSDLEIQHTGSHSFINETGTGNLYIQSSGAAINITNGSSRNIAQFNTTAGTATLFHDNGTTSSAKLATTATGVDVTGVITTDGMTTSADINFGDNDKAVFGAGSDLQIYHNGNNSYIDDTGTGNLYIRASDTVRLQSATGEQGVIVTTDGAVTLYHDNGAKLATTSTGVNVTGTLNSTHLQLGASGSAVYFEDTNYAVQGSSNNGYLKFLTAGSEKMRITAAGAVGIGTASPNAILDVEGANINFASSENGILNVFSNDATAVDKGGSISLGGNSESGSLGFAMIKGAKESTDAGYLAFGTRSAAANSTERMRISSTGKVGIGTTAPTLDGSLAGLSVNASGTVVHVNNGNGATLKLTDPATGANRGLGISLQNTEAVISNCESGSLRFGTSNAERMRIDSSGRVLTFKTASGLTNAGVEHNFTNAGGYLGVTSEAIPVYINRAPSDGGLIEFRQNNSAEGSISVSGTTVSYNGGHLSRWSQLTSNSRDDAIVKGTVMTNLDQMAEWTDEGVTEENEQLNCMAVSSIEGDANVAGVFVNWDNDDDIYTNDMNVAMTGDMIIRIAQGTTVARGDLLMSAGDGTAKPQGDDIVRSKTIAKVTSTHISHIYDDGSYLVPCVLMAC